MRVFAPGKLVLTGAYAVLEGAPAIAVAVSRGAYADSSRASLSPTPEVRAALGHGAAAPDTDASAMFVGSRKLGLGASAAILVASLAARFADAGADLLGAEVRERLFLEAHAAHAQAQRGGSGVDVATSVHGGAIRYVMGEPVKRVALPDGLEVHAFACKSSARTSDLRARIDRFARDDAAGHRVRMMELSAVAHDAARAVEAGDASAFVDGLRRTARALDALGASAGVGIVPEGFDSLEDIAAQEQASFSVSGAGGGDVAVFVGPSRPSPSFTERARALGLFALHVAVDERGVRPATERLAVPSPAPGAHAKSSHIDVEIRSPYPRNT